MKAYLPIYSKWAAACSAIAVTLASVAFAAEKKADEKPTDGSIQYSANGTWWERHYVNGIGLTPFHDDIVGIPKPDTSEAQWREILTKVHIEDIRYPGADLLPVKRTARPGEYLRLNSPLLVLRVQDDLVSKPLDAQPATVFWENDRHAGTSSTLVNAALLAEFYFPGFGGKTNFGGYTPEGMFHLVAGAEAEQFDSGDAAKEVDIRRYAIFAEFSPLGILGYHNTAKDGSKLARQTMGAGWAYEEDLVADARRHSFLVKYHPSFTLPFTNLWVGERSYFKRFAKFYGPNGGAAAEPLDAVLGGAGAPAPTPAGNEITENSAGNSEPVGSQIDKLARANAKAANEVMEKNKVRSFFFLRPTAGLDFGDTQSVQAIFDEQPNINLVYAVEAGLSFGHETFSLAYRLKGVTGIDGGESHVCQEVIAQLTPRGWPGRVFASYKNGEDAPSFKKVDVIQVGVGFKL